MFLTGRAEHQIDDKGRFRIPAKFKNAIGKHPFVTIGMSGCLYIYPEDHAQQMFADYFKGVNPYSTDSKLDGMRKVFGNGEFLEEDAQSRLLLPKYLMEAAGISKNVISVGMMDHIELWSESGWNEFDKKTNVNDCFKTPNV